MEAATQLRAYNPDNLPVTDPIDDAAWRWLSKAGILAETDAGRLFRHLCRLAKGRAGYRATLPRRVLLVESGVGSSSGLSFALKRLRETGLAVGTSVGRGLLEVVLLAAPVIVADAQKRLPGMESEEVVATVENEQSVCSNGLNKPVVQIEQTVCSNSETDPDKIFLAQCVADAKARLGKPVKNTGAASASPPRAAEPDQTAADSARDSLRSKSKSLSSTKDLDLDLAEKQKKLAEAKTKALKKTAGRAIRIEQLRLAVPGLFPQIARQIIADLDSGLYPEKVVTDVIDRGLKLVEDGKVPELWNYVEGSMRACAAERKRPWPPKREWKR